MKSTLRKRRTAPSSWKLKAFNYNTVIIMKRTGWKSDFSSEKSKTIRSEKRMKRENNEWKGISLKEHSQPADFKNADDADDRLISMNICHHQSKNLALDRWKTKIQMSSKCTEVTRAPLIITIISIWLNQLISNQHQDHLNQTQYLICSSLYLYILNN